MNVLNKVLSRFRIDRGRASRQPLHVFVLDDDVRRHESFRRNLARDEVDVAETAAEAIEMLSANYYDEIYLDHDLLPEHYHASEHDDRETGYAVARWLAENPQHQSAATIIVHTRNADGAMRMVELLRRAGRIAEYVPFPVLTQRLKQQRR